MDEERDRRLDEMYRNSESQRGSGGSDELLFMIVGIVVGLGLLLAGAGWLDAQFGWGIRDWLTEKLLGS